MTNNLEDQVQRIVANMDNQEQDTTSQPPQDEIQDIYVLIVREREEAEAKSDLAEAPTQVFDSTPPVPMQSTPVRVSHDSFLSAYLFVCCSVFLLLATLVFQLYLLFNPPIATVTIIPRSQTVTLNGTLQLGRVIRPITISQSQSTPTTGHGHQDAKAATGTVTFFNGLFTQQFIASGTVYTGQDGVAIVTTQDATIPPGSPSTGYGTVTVTAQALQAGSKGNIRSGDIDIAINNGLLVRNSQFYNGQDQRDYQTVTRSDVTNTAAAVTSSLDRSINGALQGQAKPHEQLQILPCNPTVSSTHQPGDEATTVKVTVSETCSAVAYNNQELQTKATAYLTTQARHKTGAGYSLFGTVQVRVTQAIIQKQVIVSYDAQGTWVYALSHTVQQQIKRLIAGKTTQEALQLLASLPGVEQATIRFTGFGDDTRVPKDTCDIHIHILVQNIT
jgi:hypothetical protein